jgi:hypothetical protein
MIIRNKKNGTNILAFKNNRVIIRGGETVDIPALTDFNDITNKADFLTRGWFEVVNKTENVSNAVPTKEETGLDKAKKEVKEYTSKKNNEE